MITLLPKKLVKVALFALVTSAMVFGSFLVNPDIVKAQTIPTSEQVASYFSVDWYPGANITSGSIRQDGVLEITNTGGAIESGNNFVDNHPRNSFYLWSTGTTEPSYFEYSAS